jgi:hypothetical protein
MTVKELIALLGKYPPNAEVWYIEGTYGMPNTRVADYHLEMDGGKLILGYDGSGGGDVD